MRLVFQPKTTGSGEQEAAPGKQNSISIMPEKKQIQSLTISMAVTYRIRVYGYLDKEWSASLCGLVIDHLSLDDQTQLSTLFGELPDQAALAGVLNFLYNHRLPLLSVECLCYPPGLESVEAENE